MLNINTIMEVLPQRYPFLLVDRILEQKYNEYAIGCKNISVNESWSKGHFENNPIYPGAMIIESAAQTGGFIFYDESQEEHRIHGLLSSVSNFKFVKTVIPGDQLIIKTKWVQRLGNIVKISAKIYVNEERVAEGELTYVLSE